MGCSQVIASHSNICKQLHMPAQSGSTRTLERMRRGYTREAYDALIEQARSFMPQVSCWHVSIGHLLHVLCAYFTFTKQHFWMQLALSTDIIVGFCGEDEEDHLQTLDLLRTVGYDQAFLFAYSIRDKTHAARHLQVCIFLHFTLQCTSRCVASFPPAMHNSCQAEDLSILRCSLERLDVQDNVPQDVKLKRLNKAINLFKEVLSARNQAEVSRRHLVMVEGPSRRSPGILTGRTCTGKRVYFNDGGVLPSYVSPKAGISAGRMVRMQPGDFVAVHVTSATASALQAVPLAVTSTAEFVRQHGSTVGANSAAISIC